MYYFKAISFTLWILLQINTGFAESELLGPYQCPSDSRCQDVNSCSSAYKKKTTSGKLFYCGPQNRVDYMVCCMEKDLNWDQPTGDEMENELLAMLMPNKNDSSPKYEFGQNMTKPNGPTSFIANILSTENKTSHNSGNEIDNIFGELENVDSGNSLYSNSANIFVTQDPVPQSSAPVGPDTNTNPQDLKRDSRKSFAECNCERGLPGPPGPPGENGKVIYVPILISSSTPTLSLPPDVAVSALHFMQQGQQQPPAPLHESVPQTQSTHPNSQNTQRQTINPPPYHNSYVHKAPAPLYTTNPSPSLQNKIKRHSHF